VLRLLACLALSVDELARTLELPRKGTRAVVRQLQAAGLVEVAPAPQFRLYRENLGLITLYRTVLATNGRAA
jgi:DNA-binding IclR family transcriptional regulator